MAKVLLIKPASYTLGGVIFQRGIPRIVSDKLGEQALKRPKNFKVEFAADINRMAEAKVRTAITRPVNEAEFVDAVMGAAESLDPKDPAHFTQAGKPSVAALTEMLGYPVTAKERDDIFGEMTPDQISSLGKPAPEQPKEEPKVVSTETHKDKETGATIRITKRVKASTAAAEAAGDKPDEVDLEGDGEPLDTADQQKQSDEDDKGGMDV